MLRNPIFLELKNRRDTQKHVNGELRGCLIGTQKMFMSKKKS